MTLRTTLLLGCFATLASAHPLLAPDPGTTVELGPLLPGSTSQLRVRSDHPDAPALLLTAFSSAALPSLAPGIPALGVPLTSAISPLLLDSSGRFELPVGLPADFSATGLQVRVQLVVIPAGGAALEASNVATTTLAPGLPGTFLQPSSHLLPASASGSAPFAVEAEDFDLDG
ncbi:MAG: hypothetical protein P1V81_18310, partial [Planctomycetota bacterium]|nr:hypothetical protein [Planctomycetota bacterium]